MFIICNVFSKMDLEICKWLDMYLYKLIWKYLKKLHSKRTNVWIYNKYWKKIYGFPRLLIKDNLSQNIYFLKSHSLFVNFLYRIPLSLNIFDLFYNRYLWNILFSKFLYSFSNSYRILYINQKGLCEGCKRPICFKNYKILKIEKNSQSSFVRKFFLYHSYCNINL